MAFLWTLLRIRKIDQRVFVVASCRTSATTLVLFLWMSFKFKLNVRTWTIRFGVETILNREAISQFLWNSRRHSLVKMCSNVLNFLYYLKYYKKKVILRKEILRNSIYYVFVFEIQILSFQHLTFINIHIRLYCQYCNNLSVTGEKIWIFEIPIVLVVIFSLTTRKRATNRLIKQCS